MLTSALPRFFIFAFLLTISAPSYANDECGLVRLDSKGGSLEHVKLRQQLGGTCFMEVAVQMFDAYRMMNGADANSNSSGFMAALEMAKANGKNTLDNDGKGGYVCEAFDFMTEHGTLNLDQYMKSYVNPEKRFMAAIYGLNSQRKFYLEKITNSQKLYFEEKKLPSYIRSIQDNTLVSVSSQVNRIEKLEQEQEFAKKYGDEILKYTISMANYYAKDLFPDLKGFDYDAFFKELFTQHAQSEVDFIEKVMKLNEINSQLRNNISSTKPSCRTHRYTTITPNSAVLHDLNKMLSRGRDAIPVSVNLCSTVYEQGRKFIAGARTVGTFFDQKNCHQHAVILMGRRKNPTTNRCQFLVRNSEGETCANSSNDWNCEKKLGALWIDADKLAEATARIEFVD